MPYEPVVFIDNQPVLDLIEKKPHGLMNLLDEEVRLPKGDDNKWLSKCSGAHLSHPNWISDKMQARTCFSIQHYAGEVVYDSTGFVEKNRDSVFRDIYDLMTDANHPNFKLLFPEKDKNPRRVETLGGNFRKQLTHLMSVCDATAPHYIRCIKPNSNKMAKQFNAKMCLEQLTYAGVFEAVQIRKTGYPFRLSHQRFVARYRSLLKNNQNWARLSSSGDLVATCRAILTSVQQDFSKVAIGLTMVLYRAEEHRVLELLRNLCLEKILPVAQRVARRYIGRKYIKVLKQVRDITMPAIQDGQDAFFLEQVIEKSLPLLAPFNPIFNHEPHHLARAKYLRFRLQERIDLNILFRELLHKDPLLHFASFASAVKRSDKIKDMPGMLLMMQR